MRLFCAWSEATSAAQNPGRQTWVKYENNVKPREEITEHKGEEQQTANITLVCILIPGVKEIEQADENRSLSYFSCVDTDTKNVFLWSAKQTWENASEICLKI